MAASESKKNVRISKELSEGEQKATASRKKEIKEVLAKDGIVLDEAKIPNIAVLGSGGGLRAMIALYGTLSQLKKCGLLDYVMYLGGVSGSTWCMSALYKNKDWAKNTEDLAILPRIIPHSWELKKAIKALIEAVEDECYTPGELCRCMSALYKNKDWAKNTEDLAILPRIIPHSWELKKAIKALIEAMEDECYSLTDFWAYFVVYEMLKELHESKLSDQQNACKNGENPYPIYAVVDKHTYEGKKASSWFEFTPHEVGVLDIHDHPGVGAYIATENFGSKYNKGKMVEKKKEKKISFLQGLWGSALGSEKAIMEYVKATLKKIIGRCSVHSSTEEGHLKVLRMNEAMKNSIQEKAYSHHDSITDTMKLKKITEVYQYLVELHLFALEDNTIVAREDVDIIGNILQRYGSRESYELFRELDKAWLCGDAKRREDTFIKLFEVLDREFEVTQRGGKGGHECLYGSTGFSLFDFYGLLKIVWKTTSCLFGWTWGTTNNFMMNCCDVKPDHLKKEKNIFLMDAGVANNTAYPLVLHPKRNVKLILSFDFSEGGPFETLYRASEYCKENNIPFPDINENELLDKEPSNCYIFNTKHLTIMHFPLFNKDNCKGEIDDYWKTYGTFKMSYSEEEITKLLSAAKKNVGGVEEKIREEIKRLYGHSS